MALRQRNINLPNNVNEKVIEVVVGPNTEESRITTDKCQKAARGIERKVEDALTCLYHELRE